MTLEELKELGEVAQMEALFDLSDEILALVEALAKEEADRYQGSVFCPDSIVAYRAFTAKLETL